MEACPVRRVGRDPILLASTASIGGRLSEEVEETEPTDQCLIGVTTLPRPIAPSPVPKGCGVSLEWAWCSVAPATPATSSSRLCAAADAIRVLLRDGFALLGDAEVAAKRAVRQRVEEAVRSGRRRG